MSAPELEDALVEFIAANVHELRFKSNNETDVVVSPTVYAAFIPRNQVGEVIPGMITTYPAIIVRVRQGMQTVDYEVLSTEILLGVYDDGLDQQGSRDCLNLVQRIKDRIREQSLIRERYRLAFPLNWQINKRASASGGSDYNSFPYYFAEMQIDFQDTVMASQYEVDVHTPDVTPGKFNVPGMPEVEIDEY
jgi:hypothetical protein